MNPKADKIKKELFAAADEDKKAVLSSFFKTGKGEYGEGDKFIGVAVPVQRAIIKKYKSMDFEEIDRLVCDEYHECRLTGLMILVSMFNKAKSEPERKAIYDFYIAHADHINNWDLVDLTARDIVGGYLYDKSRKPLYEFARAKHLWLQRISIISTYYFIKRNDFADTFAISTILLKNKHDLIHKAVGWMLREVGKQNFDELYKYLINENRYTQMPRTMLRYAIEKFPADLRQKFLKGKI